MLVPYSWLKEFVKTDKDPQEIADLLTMVGLEVEGVESQSGEIVFDIGITPNRPDCLSLVGIARELRACTGEELILPEYRVNPDFREDFKISIDSPLCRRYAGRIIKDVKVGTSPDWMVKRLELSGLRPINNVVDITNYVLLEFGHPLHAFDLDTLKGQTIRVDTSDRTRKIKTLDGIEREVTERDLLIWDLERPVAIAGVMGGLETEVTEKTTNVFLESAYFEPLSVRKTSRRLGLKTEASYRFERGTDMEGLINALDRAAYLMKEICGGTVSELFDVYPSKYIPPEITLRYNRIKRLLGITLPREKVIEILESLGFVVRSQNYTSITVKVPSFRVDIEHETDLIEEIARLHGYENIPSSIPEAPVDLYPETYRERLVLIKKALLLSGFNEAINYSFMNPDLLDKLRIDKEDRRRNYIELINPLRKEDSALRSFLLPSLIHNLIHNLFQGIRDIKLFEISRVFQKDGIELPREISSLGILYFYTPGQRLWEDRTDVFYLLKGVVEKILQINRITDYNFVSTTEPFLHPGRSADLIIKDIKVGYTGILSPEIKAVFDIGEIKEDVGVVEINLDLLFKAPQKTVEYSRLPKFPAIRRDIALIVEKDIQIKTISSLLEKFESDIIEDINIFDIYEGKNLPAGKKSIAFSIIYRSPQRTLTDEDVDKVHHRLIEYMINKTGGQLRS